MKRAPLLYLLPIALALLNVVNLQAAPLQTLCFKHPRHKKRVEKQVIIDAGRLYPLPSFDPFGQMVAALKRDRKTPRFYITWYSGTGINPIYWDIMYSRPKHRLLYRCEDDEDGHHQVNSLYYSGVTDAVLERAFNVQHDADRAMKRLDKYGCKRLKSP